ncbi:MAG: hypothetical protein H7A37_10810 [Chlamydiales bacterium]|nr:hypothetical protein [Chlamydiia bacterium]MCP5508769.1 hypothetical protein [Chlamydiales bacterium]
MVSGTNNNHPERNPFDCQESLYNKMPNSTITEPLLFSLFVNNNYDALASAYDAADELVKDNFFKKHITHINAYLLDIPSRLFQQRLVGQFNSDTELRKLKFFLYGENHFSHIYPYTMQSIHEDKNHIEFYDQLINQMSKEQLRLFIDFMLEQSSEVIVEIYLCEEGVDDMQEPGILCFLVSSGAGMERIGKAIQSSEIDEKTVERMFNRLLNDYLSCSPSQPQYHHTTLIKEGIEKHFIPYLSNEKRTFYQEKLNEKYESAMRLK